MSTEDNEEPVVESTSERRPGQELARAREQAGIGLRAMADTLHLPESQLRALESDDYESLPPPTFVRGYLRSYARVLGLDDDDIVAAYDAVGSAAEDPKLHLSGGREASAHRRGLALSLTAFALVVAVSLGAWWWQSSATGSAGPLGPAADAGEADTSEENASAEQAAARDAAAQAADADASTTSSAQVSGTQTDAPEVAAVDEDALSPDRLSEPRTEPQSATAETSGRANADGAAQTYGLEGTDDADGGAASEADEPSAEPSPEEQASEEPASEEQNSAQQVSEEAETTDVDQPANSAEPSDAAEVESYDPPAATASAEAATAPQAAEGPELLRVQVDGRTWIEINDARGRELVYTLYSGSAPLELRGWPPFDVFLGNSPAVELEVNGEAVDKSAFTRSNNTARFLVDDDGARRR